MSQSVQVDQNAVRELLKLTPFQEPCNVPEALLMQKADFAPGGQDLRIRHDA
ncbi:hypothetical protein AWB78_02375 [Caballeronia calidae]|uniref:Uncharacterized protein n=1 Tax=Caballeronia calidae TaxID=1777139 RepID=A0A158B8B9_9BURK|nr:hypothetical protein AWB78_02375 [Caballeronia calidae]